MSKKYSFATSTTSTTQPLQIELRVGHGLLTGIVAASATIVVGNLAILYVVGRRIRNKYFDEAGLEYIRSILNRESILDFVGKILSDVLEHPAVDTALSHTIARGVNRWMSSVEAQDAMRAMVMQTPREEAVREFGKEVPGYVLNFAGGFVDAITGNVKHRDGHGSHGGDDRDEQERDKNTKEEIASSNNHI